MAVAPLIPALAEHLLHARLRDHTLGQVTWQRSRQTLNRSWCYRVTSLLQRSDWEKAHGKQRKTKLEKGAGTRGSPMPSAGALVLSSRP